MKRSVAFALLVLVSRHVIGADDKPTSVRFIKEQIATGVTITAKSDYLSEFTVTMEATLENMPPSRPLPFTVESAGRRSFVLARFDVTEKTRRWRYDYQPYWQFGARRST